MRTRAIALVVAILAFTAYGVANAVEVDWHSEADDHGVVEPGKEAIVELPDGTRVHLMNHGRFEWWSKKTKGGSVKVDFQEFAAVLSEGKIEAGPPSNSSYQLTLVDNDGIMQTGTGVAPISGTFYGHVNYDGSDTEWIETLGGFMSQPFLYVGEQPVSLGNFQFSPAPTPTGMPAPYLQVDWATGTFTMLHYDYVHADHLWLEDILTGERSDMIMAVQSSGAFRGADVYVSGAGIDAPGGGTESAPYRTLTYALANRGGEAVIRAAAGLYDASAGEVFPITVPAGVSIIGTMGPLKNATDSACVNAGGAAKAFVLATTAAGTTGLLQNVLITNFIGPAIDLTGWRGTIDGCYITGAVAGATNALVFYNATGNTIDLAVTNTTMENIVNGSAKHVFLFWGTGKTYFTNCVFKDITVGQPDRGAMSWEWGTSFDARLTAVTIDHIVVNGNVDNVQMGIFYSCQSVAILDRCIVRNINKNCPVINANSTLTVRDSLFYNLTTTNWGALFASNSNTVNAYNCTFDSCTAATNASGGMRNFYNCSISNCTKVNTAAANSTVRMQYVNVYNTAYGLYDPDNSGNLTAYDPKYRDRAAGNFHLQGNSRLVDAGSGTYVTWATPLDIDGDARVLDGNYDLTAAVDIGADEFNTNPAAPVFSVAPFFHVFEGSPVDVPIGITPPAGGSVDAAVTYDTGLSGPATLTIADGEGPETLAVLAADGTGSATGTPIDVAIEDAAGTVGTANCTVLSYDKVVTISGAAKLFLAPGGQAHLPLKLMSSSLEAPADINITVGSPSGGGTNEIQWVDGLAKIPAGEWESDGALSITAVEGVNTVHLAVDGGFQFDESGDVAFDLQVICLGSTIYVSGAGSDTDGIGTETSPFRSITRALTFVPDVMAIIAAPGLYNAANGETFRIVVPAGVSITGTMGTARDETDSAVVDGDGVGEIFRLKETAAGTTGLVRNLVIRNFVGPAINLTGWRGTIDGCYITGGVAGATSALIFLHSPASSGATDPSRPIDLVVTDTVMENITNASAKHVFLFNNNGNGKTWFTNCVFKDITVGTPDRGAMSWEWSNVNYDIRLTGVTIDHIVVTGSINDAQKGILYTAQNTGILDRCIVRNINKNGPVINSNKTLTVRSSLFYNLLGGTWGALFASNSNIVNASNCTFDGCSAVTNTSGGWRYLYNCSVSDCTKVNGHTNTTMQLKTVNVSASDIGAYDLNGSSGITNYVPNYRDGEGGDFRLKKTSSLVDAGSNAYVTWADPLDLLGNPRILAGVAGGTATVDLGACEYDPLAPVPTFTTPEGNYAVFAGDSLAIPVSITPQAAGAVEANVSLGTGLTGPGMLSLPDGKGPVDLVVAADADAGSDDGTVADIDIAWASGPSVEPGACTVTIYNKKVKLAGVTRLFLADGETAEFKVSLISSELQAPTAIAFGVGAPAGSGSNDLAWAGDTTIPAGESESGGSLSITAGLGVNTIEFTVGGGFAFTETGGSTLTLEVIGFASPIYVAGIGSDLTGTGTEESPLRSIAKALALVPRAMEIRVGPGLYDTANGETFRTVVPAGVSIIGTRGSTNDETDSAVIDAGGAGQAISLQPTPAGTTGLVSGLVITNFVGPAIDLTGWRGTIDDCYITGSVAGITEELLFCNQAGVIDLTVTNTVMENLTNTGAQHVLLFNGSGTTHFTGCVFKDITVGQHYGARGSMNWEWNTTFDIMFLDTVFDHVTITPTGEIQSGILWPSRNAMLLDRCIVRNFNVDTTIVSASSSTVTVRDTLFHSNNSGNWASLAGANGATVKACNCTFDNCSAATSTNGAAALFYNTGISNCGTTNIGTPTALTLLNVNVFNTVQGPYNVGASGGITEDDPLYADAGNLDFRLQRTSTLVDAGDNAHVTWTYPNPDDPENPLPPQDLDGLARIVDGDADEVETVDIGCYELQPPSGAIIREFTASDQSTGSTLFTNSDTVTVAFTVNAPEGVIVIGWLVTESPTPPTEGWLTELPAAYRITGGEGDVTLYAWITDSMDLTAGKSASIYYSSALPTVSNILVTDNGDGSATVTWDTDIETYGSVLHKVLGTSDVTTVAEPDRRTSHSVQLAGLLVNTTYVLVIVNNEKAEPPIYFPKWPIEGDANLDCRVNILDLIFIRNRLNQDPATGDNWQADVNQDTRINILDLIFVRNRLNNSCP